MLEYKETPENLPALLKLSEINFSYFSFPKAKKKVCNYTTNLGILDEWDTRILNEYKKFHEVVILIQNVLDRLILKISTRFYVKITICEST